MQVNGERRYLVIWGPYSVTSESIFLKFSKNDYVSGQPRDPTVGSRGINEVVGSRALFIFF